MRMRKSWIAALGASAGLAACAGEQGPTVGSEEGGQVSVKVAPLGFPGTTFEAITNATYNLTFSFSNGIGGWTQLEALTGIESFNFNNPEGSLSYVGPCAVSDPNTPMLNQVCAEITQIEVLDPNNPSASPTNPATWVPIESIDSNFVYPDELCQTFMCVENADVAVQFLFNILREANQGFTDVTIDIEDYFCSAKVDCVENLLVNAEGERLTSLVTGLACTPGAGEADGGVVFNHAIVCKTASGGPVTLFAEQLNPNATPNQQCTYLVDHEYYTGQEDVEEKWYKNTATAFDPDVLDLLGVTSCTYRATGAVVSTPDQWTPYFQQNAVTINWNVAINFTATFDCVNGFCENDPTVACTTQNAPQKCGIDYSQVDCVGTDPNIDAAFTGDGVHPKVTTMAVLDVYRQNFVTGAIGQPTILAEEPRDNSLTFRMAYNLGGTVEVPGNLQACEAQKRVAEEAKDAYGAQKSQLDKLEKSRKSAIQFIEDIGANRTSVADAASRFAALDQEIIALAPGDRFLTEPRKAELESIGQRVKGLKAGWIAVNEAEGLTRIDTLLDQLEQYGIGLARSQRNATAVTGFNGEIAGAGTLAAGHEAIWIGKRDQLEGNIAIIKAELEALQSQEQAIRTAVDDCFAGQTTFTCAAPPEPASDSKLAPLSQLTDLAKPPTAALKFNFANSEPACFFGQGGTPTNLVNEYNCATSDAQGNQVYETHYQATDLLGRTTQFFYRWTEGREGMKGLTCDKDYMHFSDEDGNFASMATEAVIQRKEKDREYKRDGDCAAYPISKSQCISRTDTVRNDKGFVLTAPREIIKLADTFVGQPIPVDTNTITSAKEVRLYRVTAEGLTKYIDTVELGVGQTSITASLGAGRYAFNATVTDDGANCSLRPEGELRGWFTVKSEAEYCEVAAEQLEGRKLFFNYCDKYREEGKHVMVIAKDQQERVMAQALLSKHRQEKIEGEYLDLHTFVNFDQENEIAEELLEVEADAAEIAKKHQSLPMLKELPVELQICKQPIAEGEIYKAAVATCAPLGQVVYLDELSKESKFNRINFYCDIKN